jgi:hypothetical protein
MVATYAHVLEKRYPGTFWTVTENDYNSLIWYPENTQPQPTEEELIAHLPTVDVEVRWDKVRNKRTKLLAWCDWTQMPDNPLSTELRDAWAIYRQQLRDITSQPVEPELVIWPDDPTS